MLPAQPCRWRRVSVRWSKGPVRRHLTGEPAEHVRRPGSTGTCVRGSVSCWADGRRHVAGPQLDPGRAQRGRGGRRRLGACCPTGPAASGPDPALLGHRPAGVPWSLGRVAGRMAPGPGGRRLAGPRGVRRRRRCGDGHHRGVGARPPPAAGRLASRSPSGACRDLPRGGGGGGGFVTASSALGEALAVFLCPLGVALALLAQPRPQVLGLGGGASAQQVGVRLPAAVLAGSAGAGKSEGTWAPLNAGPWGRAQVVSARSSGAVAVLALQWSRIVRAALVTVSAACRTWVRSPPAQPAT